MIRDAVDFGLLRSGDVLVCPYTNAQFPDIADAAAREQMSYRGFLSELVMAECDDCVRRRSERRINAAVFPREKSLHSFDFDANPQVNPAVIHTLATCDWVKKGLPLCLIGDSGTGESHLLGQVERVIELLKAERGIDPTMVDEQSRALGDVISATLALCLADAGRERERLDRSQLLRSPLTCPVISARWPTTCGSWCLGRGLPVDLVTLDDLSGACPLARRSAPVSCYWRSALAGSRSPSHSSCGVVTPLLSPPLGSVRPASK